MAHIPGRQLSLHLPHDVIPHPSKANIKGLAIAVVYGLSSASMAFANKALLTTYHYDFPIFIVVAQMVASIIALESLRLTGRIDLPAFSLDRGWSFFLPTVFYSINAILSLWALSGMNIPMYGIMKRCGPLVILILGPLILKKGPPSCKTAFSVACITAGCVIAGYGDRSFDAEDYTICAISVVSQVLYLLLVQKSSQTYTATETLHINSYNSLPLLLVCAAIFGELSDGLANFRYLDVGFLLMFTFVIGMGCLLNYLLFLCTSYNSALTTSVVGVVKSALQTSVGVFTFGGISINRFTLTGMLMNLAGGSLYVLAKYQDSHAKEVSQTNKDKGLAVVENGVIPKSLPSEKEEKEEEVVKREKNDV